MCPSKPKRNESVSFPFPKRLQRLLEGRKQTPWGEQLGSNKGTIYRMFQGEIPRWETLCAIQHAENASLSWLLTGEGAPYLATRRDTDAQCAALAGGLLARARNWSAYIAYGQACLRCLVLTRPAAFQVGGRRVPYTALAVVAGPIGPQTLSVLEGLAGRQHLWLAPMADDAVTHIAQGEVGTFGLLGEAGLLQGAAPAARRDVAELRAAWSEDGSGHEPMLRVAEAAAHPDPLCHNVRRLNEQGRSVVRATVEALLEGEGHAWEEPYR